MHARFVGCFFIVTAALYLATVSHAIDLNWTGSTDNDFNDAANWSPAGVPGDGDTASIDGDATSGDTVDLSDDVLDLDGLTLSNGARLLTNFHRITVDDSLMAGPITLPNRSVTLLENNSELLIDSFLGGPEPAFNPDVLEIRSGSRLAIAAVAITATATVQADSSITVDSTSRITSSNGILVLGGRLNNNGVLSAFVTPMFVTPDSVQLRVDALNGSSAIVADLDGSNETGRVTVATSNRMIVNAPIADSYDTFMSLGRDAYLTIEGDLDIGSEDISYSELAKLEVTGELTLGLSDSGSNARVFVDEPLSVLKAGNGDLNAIIVSGSAPSDLRLIVSGGTATPGKMIVRDGAVADFEFGGGMVGGRTGEAGDLEITGEGSRVSLGQMEIGALSSGVVAVSDAATLNNAGSVRLGLRSSGDGAATVDGPDSTWTIANLITVGAEGAGALNITGGGAVLQTGGFGPSAYIADGPSSVGVATVTGSGSRWLIDEDLLVARRRGSTAGGDATLNIAGGGHVEVTRDVIIGGDSNGWVNAVVNIGSSGSLAAGGDVLILKAEAGDTGVATLTLTGGTLTAASIRIEDKLINEGVSTINASIVEVMPGSMNRIIQSLTLNSDLTVADDAAFIGGGTIRLTGTHVANLADGAHLGTATFQNEGQLVLGSAEGELATSSAGAFHQTASGHLDIDISNSTPGEFDSLSLARDITLAGALNVNLTDSTIALGDNFRILNSVIGSVNGVFDAVTLPSLDDGLMFEVVYNSTNVTLQVVELQLLFGDADNDLAVSGSDLLAVTNNFGNTGPADGLLLGDADDDGSVSGSDLLAVTNNFGTTLGGSLASSPDGEFSPVPEPGSLALVSSLILALGCLRWSPRA